jgi:hypothetical protein
MISLQAIVEVLGTAVLGCGEQGTERGRVALGLVAGHAGGLSLGCAERSLEEGMGRCGITPVAQGDVADLAWLVDGPNQIPPAAGDLGQRHIDPPARADPLSMLLGGLEEQRRERLDPIEEGARVDGDAPLGEPLSDVSLAQALAQVPPHGQGDHLVREALPAERRPAALRSAAPTSGAAPELPSGTIPACFDQPLARASPTPHSRLRP